MRIKTWGATCLCVFTVTTLAACGSSSSATGDKLVKVGVVLSITGPAGSLGSPERDTLNAFKDRLSNVAGGTRIQWIVADDRSDTNGAVSAVNRLITEDHVDAIICCTTSPNSLAVQTAISPTGIPNIAIAAASAITEPQPEKKLFFKTVPTDGLSLSVTAQDMQKRGLKRVAFLGSDDAYGESGLGAFRAAASRNGITVSGSQKFSPTATDVTAQLTQLRRGNPSAYMIWGVPPAAAIAQRDVSNLGVTEPVYQGLGVTNQTFLKVSGPSANGVRIAAGRLLIASSLSADDPLNKSILAFVDRYRQKVGETPNPFAGYAHDAMLVMHDAINRAVRNGAKPGSGDTFHKQIRDAIEATHDLVGVTGVFNYSLRDHVGLSPDSVEMIEVKNGEYAPASGS